jgi:hypothetical protein
MKGIMSIHAFNDQFRFVKGGFSADSILEGKQQRCPEGAAVVEVSDIWRRGVR